MPDNVIISEGKTTNEAIEKGLKLLNVSKNMVDIKVLENEDKRSFFSILAPRTVKVELTLKEKKDEVRVKKERKKVEESKINEAEENVKIFLNDFLSKFNEKLTYKINKNEYGLEVAITGDNQGALIGYRGETLYALQTILSSVANKNIDERIQLILDIGDFKEKRIKTLEMLAKKIASSVEKTRKSVTLEPMQAYERKIIHSALQDSTKVKTESIGEEPKRRVVISLK